MEKPVFVKELERVYHIVQGKKRIRKYWIVTSLYKCSCGKEFVSKMPKNYVRNSCGCIKRGHGKKGTSEHMIWEKMNDRCINPNHNRYQYYGGKGIRVCDRWKGKNGFMNFLTDMGEKPTPQHSIDRIDVNGNYEPGNCRWATAIEQANNKSTNRIIEYKNEKNTLKEWTRLLNLVYCATLARLNRGWDVESAFEKPRYTKHIKRVLKK